MVSAVAGLHALAAVVVIDCVQHKRQLLQGRHMRVCGPVTAAAAAV